MLYNLCRFVKKKHLDIYPSAETLMYSNNSTLKFIHCFVLIC